MLTDRHGQVLDAEALDPALAARELVVPAELELLEVGAQGHRSGGDLDPLLGRDLRRAIEAGPGRGPALQRVVELVDHVGQRLVVHQLVLEHETHDAVPLAERIAVAGVDLRVDAAHLLPDPVAVLRHLRHVRPPPPVFRGLVAPGVDPALEELLERGVDGRLVEHAATDLVPGEGGKVPQVEDERVTMRDGAVGPGAVQQPEQVVARAPGALELLEGASGCREADDLHGGDLRKAPSATDSGHCAFHLSVLGSLSMKSLSPLPLLLLLALVSCGAGTPQRDEDLPYRTGTLERYEDGTLETAKLVEPTEIEGYPCRGWISFHRNGRIEACDLARDAEVVGHLLPEGTRLFLEPDGTLDDVFLGRDTELAGLPCNGGGKIMAGFHPDGRLRYAFLSEDTEIQGVPCEASVFTEVSFHPGGELAGCKLSRAFELDGVRLKRGAVIELDREGRLQDRGG
jgi:hypothetical protein